MQGGLKAQDWIRIMIGFCLGVVTTLLVIQLTSGGELFQGFFKATNITRSTIDTTDLTRVPADDLTKETEDQFLKSMERLDSGSRIDSAKDDAEGLIDDPFRMEEQDLRNVGDGIDLGQTAEGALGEDGNMDLEQGLVEDPYTDVPIIPLPPEDVPPSGEGLDPCPDCYCGNNHCDVNETNETCRTDCYCGDNYCRSAEGENRDTCPADCA